MQQNLSEYALVSSHYRGIEFSVDLSGDGIWHWAAVVSPDATLHGECCGSQENAMRACFEAIDDSLGTGG
jgi:hypothetical protein